MAARKKGATKAAADKALAGLFTTAPQNRTKAQKIEATGTARAKAKKAEAAAPIDESAAATPAPRRKPATGAPRSQQAEDLDIDLDDLPMLNAPWMKIQETTFSCPDPEREHEELRDQLKLTDALTPGNLQAALNQAEDNARRAHKLYIVATSEFELFELEMTPVVEAMREAANRDLQGEKDRKERSKAITDADIKGRASVLFPDEWGMVQERRIKAERMMDHLKVFADVWKQRCFSLSSMLNAGKRS